MGSPQDYCCPDCGGDLVPMTDDTAGSCLQCGRVKLDDADVDLSSPFDVRLTDDSIESDRSHHRVVVSLGTSKTIRLTPQEALNFGNALKREATDASEDIVSYDVDLE